MGKHNSKPKPMNTTKNIAKTSEWAEELPWGSSNQNSQEEGPSALPQISFWCFFEKNSFPAEFPHHSSMHIAVFLQLKKRAGW